MIPYDELVMALRSWRERNGMPTSSSSASSSASSGNSERGPRRRPPPMERPSERNIISDDEVLESADVDQHGGGDYSLSFEPPSAAPQAFVASATEPNGWAGHHPTANRRR